MIDAKFVLHASSMLSGTLDRIGVDDAHKGSILSYMLSNFTEGFPNNDNTIIRLCAMARLIRRTEDNADYRKKIALDATAYQDDLERLYKSMGGT